MKFPALTKNIAGILFFLFFCSLNLFAQADEFCSLEVNVLDAETNEKITADEIQIVNLDKKVLYKPSLEQSNFFENVYIGNAAITVIKNGYHDKHQKVSLECKNLDNGIGNISVSISKKTGEDGKGIFLIGTNDRNPSTVNEGAVYLGRPTYPAAARATRASGTVQIQVVIDLEGSVIYAKAVEGHPLLRSVSEKAAVESKFKPTLLEGKPVMVSGIIVYNFVP